MQTHLYSTHSSPVLLSLPSKCECGVVHWQRQLQPEEKDKQEQTKPLVLASQWRGHRCALLCHPLSAPSLAPLNLINWLQKRGHQLSPQVIIQFLGKIKYLCLSTAEFGAITAGWKSERSGKNCKNTPKTFSPSLAHKIGFQPVLTPVHSAHLRQLPLKPIPSPSRDPWHSWLTSERAQERKTMVRERLSSRTWGRGQQERPCSYCWGEPLAMCSFLQCFVSSNCRPPQGAQSWIYWVKTISAVNGIYSPTWTRPILIQNGEGTYPMANCTAHRPRHWRYPGKNPCLFS